MSKKKQGAVVAIAWQCCWYTLQCTLAAHLVVAARAGWGSCHRGLGSTRRASHPRDCVDALLDDLNGTFHRLRQSGIDEELFDVISGFEALKESL